ncbi:MAG: hypothetical protein A2122_02940 [Candidatus Liptonbacteria bacterium GWB1_49_6]|uniref:Uncharacterized protein n=1 Tax=Candidatus Liptonbacteria bacterium GWB1_49_6 TaxID=1798644 RepID=A0A1G2C892_9BACT|nr:MAG: hypothetical protein A2122_02940 [Candidatus Liptonbacteria bacterium GWB1_49_6]
MSYETIPKDYPIVCTEAEIVETIKKFQESIKSNSGVTPIVQRASAVIQLGQMELAARLSRKHSVITEKLKIAVTKFDKSSGIYSKKLIGLTRWLIALTVVMLIAIGIQIYFQIVFS